jgi:hypothetical protein
MPLEECRRILHLVETLEDKFALALRDPHAVVHDRDEDAALQFLHLHVYGRAGR